MNSIKTINLLAFCTALFFITSCSSSEIGNSKDVNQETIYQDYRIKYDENENGNQVEVFTQFRFAGENGTTLVLTKPSKIELDGTSIKVDSNDYAGAYYKVEIPVHNFWGAHHFMFTDINNKKFDNTFSFDHFTLTGVPAAVSKNAPAVISFDAPPLKDEDYVELTATDTDSTFSVKHTAAEAGNNITIPLAELKRQKGSSFSVTASIYRKIPLQQPTGEGGKITIFHSLKPIKIKLTDSTEYAVVAKF